MTDDTRYAETRNRQDDVETTPAPSAGRVLHGLSIKHGTGSAKQDGTRRQWWVTDLTRTTVSPPTEGGEDTDAVKGSDGHQTDGTANGRRAGGACTQRRVHALRAWRRLTNR